MSFKVMTNKITWQGHVARIFQSCAFQILIFKYIFWLLLFKFYSFESHVFKSYSHLFEPYFHVFESYSHIYKIYFLDSNFLKVFFERCFYYTRSLFAKYLSFFNYTNATYFQINKPTNLYSLSLQHKIEIRF